MKKVLLFITFVFVLFGCSKDENISVSVSQSVLVTSKNSVKNGEIISLTADIKGEANGKPIVFSVTYFCDQNEIGHSDDSTSKSRYDYTIQNKAEYRDGDTYSYSTASSPLIVTE